jgi:hypothetical protein
MICTDGPNKIISWVMLRPSSSSPKANKQLPNKVTNLLCLEFYKQPKEIILKVIDILEKQNKAAKIEIGSDIGVKFLQ